MTEINEGPAVIRESLSEKELAEGRMFDAQARHFAAEALSFNLDTEIKQVNITEIRREIAARLTHDRYHHVYQFNNTINGDSVNTCMKQLQEWVRLSEVPVVMEIIFNSPGGDAIAGFALFDFITHLRADKHEVTTTALGMAASMAGILLQAGKPRVMGAECYLMIHEGSFGVSGTMGAVEDTVEWIKMIERRILNIFAEHSHMTVAQLTKRWKRKNWWIDSTEALKLGLVDEVR